MYTRINVRSPRWHAHVGHVEGEPMPLGTLPKRVFMLASAVVLLLASGIHVRAAGQTPPAPTQPPRASAAETFTVLAPGVLWSATPVFASDAMPGQHVEVRNLIFGPNQNAPWVPVTTGFVLMELRAGVVEVTIDGQTSRKEGTNTWLVPRGAQLAIRNLTEITVIRTTLFLPR
jgi:hypothetical protein